MRATKRATIDEVGRWAGGQPDGERPRASDLQADLVGVWAHGRGDARQRQVHTLGAGAQSGRGAEKLDLELRIAIDK